MNDELKQLEATFYAPISWRLWFLTTAVFILGSCFCAWWYTEWTAPFWRRILFG